jgi:hypothetical protein
MYPYWDQYKQVVHDRLELPDSKKLLWIIGMIVVRVVEDMGVQEWADQLCLQGMVEAGWEEETESWDHIFEDLIGQNEQFSNACISLYLQSYL